MGSANNEACLAVFDTSIGYLPHRDEVIASPFFKKVGKRRYSVSVDVRVPTGTTGPARGSGLIGSGLIGIDSYEIRFPVGTVYVMNGFSLWSGKLYAPPRLFREKDSIHGIYEAWEAEMAAANEAVTKNGFRIRHEAAEWVILRSLKISGLWDIRSRYISPLQQLGMVAD